MPVGVFLLLIVLCLLSGGFLLLHLKRSRQSKQLEYVTLQLSVAKKDSVDKENSQEKDFHDALSLGKQIMMSLSSIEGFQTKKWFAPQPVIGFEILGTCDTVTFYITCPFKMESIIEKFFSSTYTGINIDVKNTIHITQPNSVQSYASMKLEKESFLPLRTIAEQESDPMNTPINGFSKLNPNETALIQYLIAPQPFKWNQKGQKKIEKLHEWGLDVKHAFDEEENSFLTSFVSGIKKLFQKEKEEKEKKNITQKEQETLKAMEEKIAQPCFKSNIRIISSAPNKIRADAIVRDLTASFGAYNTVDKNMLRKAKESSFFRKFLWKTPVEKQINKTIYRLYENKEETILSCEEVAQLWHIPDSRYNRNPLIEWLPTKVFPAPVNIPHEWILLGKNIYRGQSRPIYINGEDRFRHFYVIGQTGQGKSSIALTMAIQDIEQGNGLCVMDPHGELADDLISYIPQSRAKDLIYFNAADEEYPIGLNIMEPRNDGEKDKIASELNSIFLKLYGEEAWAPILQEWCMQAALALMDDDIDGSSITDIVAMFTNEDFRAKKLTRCKNMIARSWWEKNFAQTSAEEKARILPWFSSKFNSFISNGIMRNMVWQAKSTFDFWQAMTDRKIILVNLAKGAIGEQNMSLLGMIFINKIQMATMARSQMPKSARTPFFFYIDEMQNFVSPSIGEILSEVRKYKLGMVMMHQYVGQLTKNGDDSLQKAIFGNVGNMFSYKTSEDDAKVLAGTFQPYVSEQDILGLKAFEGILKMSVNNQPTPAFTLQVQKFFEYPAQSHATQEQIALMKELSRYTYGRNADIITKEILMRLGQ